MTSFHKIKGAPKRLDRILGLVALVMIVAAWYAGGLRAQTDVTPSLKQLLPEAQHFQYLREDTYAAWADKSGSRLLAYIKITEATGYGGPVTMAVTVDTQGKIIGLRVVDHKDTPSYFNRVIQSGLLKSLVGKTYRNPIILDRDVDAVSGATRSSSAIVTSSRQAVKDIARRQLDLEVPDEATPSFRFGPAESILLLLFALGILARRKGFKYTQVLRWVSLIIGLVFLGFVYDNPLTIAMINQILLGFWPDWHSNLYTYLLVGGVVLIFLVEGKNPYCIWICPFGAAQECLSKIMKAKAGNPGRYRGLLKWLHRGVALAAILVALLLRDPGLTSYEVFGTLFKMWGSAFQFSIIALVFLMSLYTLRPWCNYICPIHPVDDYLRVMKKWVKELWFQKKAS